MNTTHKNKQHIPPKTDVESDGEAHVNPNLTDDSQEEEIDELGEYADNTIEPEEVIYGGDESDFDMEYYDNEDEWDISRDKDE